MLDIDKQFKSHLVSSIVLVCSLNCLVMTVRHIWGIEGLLVPQVVSTVFVLILELTIAFAWRWVAKKHANMMASFLTAVSGFRFFTALVLLGVWYAFSTRQEMMMFVSVFLVFYIASLIHHSFFFSRVSKVAQNDKK